MRDYGPVYDDRPRQCQECRDILPGFHAYWDHLETVHEWVWRDGKVRQPDDRQIGAGRSALYALAVLGSARVHRGTLRALARVNSGTAKDPSSLLRKSLRKAELAGMIRTEGDWVHVLDRDRLYARAVDNLVDPTHERFLALHEAAPIIVEQITAERDAAVIAARERAAIWRLMHPYDGGVPRGPRAPRVIGAGRCAS